MLFVITSFVPVALILFGPLMWFISAVTPWKGFCIATVRRHTGRYTTLHLSVYDRVGHLSPRRAARFHRSFLTTLLRAVETGKRPVFFTSHLMRPAHMKSMTALLQPMTDTHRWRRRAVTIPRYVRNGIRLQILIQEWRWITVPETGALVVIRPRKGGVNNTSHRNAIEMHTQTQSI
ncbi:hypothetical protein [Lelliottia amnigena]|uniref:hypothetical protein n=1 Tax=Lelliottia amnigena TaxID=61646 RepID=UPI001C2122BA|nr:hypothetical protein [Lelliottia amnigena]QXB24125.1 hypothetical protein I6L76_23590 [Lelliottia amnigena]